MAGSKAWGTRTFMQNVILHLHFRKRKRPWPSLHANPHWNCRLVCGWNSSLGGKWSAVGEGATAQPSSSVSLSLCLSPFMKGKAKDHISQPSTLPIFLFHPLRDPSLRTLAQQYSAVFLLWSQTRPGAGIWPCYLTVVSLRTGYFTFLPKPSFLTHKQDQNIT